MVLVSGCHSTLYEGAGHTVTPTLVSKLVSLSRKITNYPTQKPTQASVEAEQGRCGISHYTRQVPIDSSSR